MEDRQQQQRVHARHHDHEDLSQGTRMTFHELRMYDPLPPPAETFNPTMHQAVTNPTNVKIVDPPRRKNASKVPRQPKRNDTNSAASCPTSTNSPMNSSDTMQSNMSMDSAKTDSTMRSASSEVTTVPPIYLMKRDDPERAYALIDKPPLVNHRGENWGVILYAVMYHRKKNSSSNNSGGKGLRILGGSSSCSTRGRGPPRRPGPMSRVTSSGSSTSSTPSPPGVGPRRVRSAPGNNVAADNASTTYEFQAPRTDEAKLVAIKRLRKRTIDAYLDRGGEENPYKEIYRMETLGDNLHVLKHYEALEDEEYMYIVTPLGTPLTDMIHWNKPPPQTRSSGVTGENEEDDDENDLNEEKIHFFAVKLFRILVYLERHGICHRDIKPSNFLVLPPDDNLVVFDLAMSHKIPQHSDGHHRVLIQPTGNYGTHCYLSPELFAGSEVFCGVYSDLWATAVTIYNLMTNQILYYQPHPTDLLFRYNILAGGLSNRPHNQLTVLVVQEAMAEDEKKGDAKNQLQKRLFLRAMAHMNMKQSALTMFERLLAPQAEQRWTLAQASDSEYISR